MCYVLCNTFLLVVILCKLKQTLLSVDWWFLQATFHSLVHITLKSLVSSCSLKRYGNMYACNASVSLKKMEMPLKDEIELKNVLWTLYYNISSLVQNKAQNQNQMSWAYMLLSLKTLNLCACCLCLHFSMHSQMLLPQTMWNKNSCLRLIGTERTREQCWSACHT